MKRTDCTDFQFNFRNNILKISGNSFGETFLQFRLRKYSFRQKQQQIDALRRQTAHDHFITGLRHPFCWVKLSQQKKRRRYFENLLPNVKYRFFYCTEESLEPRFSDLVHEALMGHFAFPPVLQYVGLSSLLLRVFKLDQSSFEWSDLKMPPG